MADNNTCISYMKIFCAIFLAICMFVSLSFVSFIFYEDEINGFIARHAIFDKYVAYINNKNDLEARLDKIASNSIRLFVENEFVKKSNELFDEAKNKINQAIETRNKNTLSSTTNNNIIDMDKSSKSLALAREQRSKANFDLASLYYTNAIYANSNDMTAIIEYVSMFKDAAINSKNDVNIATQYIELAITSLKNFTITSTSENIQVIYNLIKELMLLRNDLYEHANTDVGSNSELPQICVHIDVNSVVSNNTTTLEQKIYELDLLSNECSVFLNNLSENDKNQLVSAKTLSENLKKDAFVIESIDTINTMIKQATSESKSNYDYAMNILSNVQSIFSGVFAVASKNVKNDVESSYSMYKKATNDINEAHDKQIINSIENTMGVNSIRSNDTATIRIDKYTKYINELNKSFALLRAESSRSIVQEKIQNAEKTIISIQKNMIENYNRWAIGRIDELYTHYDKNIDKLTKSFRKEDDIVRVLDDYLSNIDPSLLSHPATQIYNEILSLLYGKLNAENKIKVSRMLNNATKRGLD